MLGRAGFTRVKFNTRGFTGTRLCPIGAASKSTPSAGLELEVDQCQASNFF
jgi:hypothetical protein